jgi:hypothetical protein
MPVIFFNLHTCSHEDGIIIPFWEDWAGRAYVTNQSHN